MSDMIALNHSSNIYLAILFLSSELGIIIICQIVDNKLASVHIFSVNVVVMVKQESLVLVTSQ